MQKRKASKRHTGGTRMVEIGYKPIQVWVDSHDLALLREAAEFDARPVSKFVLLAACNAARELLLKKLSAGMQPLDAVPVRLEECAAAAAEKPKRAKRR